MGLPLRAPELILMSILLLGVLATSPTVSSQSAVGTLILAYNENNLTSAVIDPTADFAYFGTSTFSSHSIVKVRLSDFTRVAALALGAPLPSAVIDPVNGFAYFAYYGEGFGSSGVAKVRLSDFVHVGSLSLDEGSLRSAVIDTVNGFAYFGGHQAIFKIGLSDFTLVGSLTLNPGEEYPTSAVIDPANGFAYFGTAAYYGAGPVKIVKIRLSDFTRVDALTFELRTEFTSAIVDTAAGFAYFGTGTEPGTVVKVRLSDLSLVASLTLNHGEDNLYSAVIDNARGLAYFGTNTDPGRIVTMRLSDFNRVGALTLNPGENRLTSATLDPTSGFAYFGTYTEPGRVVKIIAPARHDIAARRVSVSSSPVIIGEKVNVSVTVANEGLNPETFPLTLKADDITVGTHTLTLDEGNVRNETFLWNTAGLAAGVYSFSATAGPVMDELDLSDNTLSQGRVSVRSPTETVVAQAQNLNQSSTGKSYLGIINHPSGTGTSAIGQVFANEGQKDYVLKRFVARILYWGSPTVRLTAVLYRVTGSYGANTVPTGQPLLTSSNSINVTTIVPPSEVSDIEFYFDDAFVLGAGGKYGIAIEASSSGIIDRDNSIGVQTIEVEQAKANDYGGNAFQFSGGAWSILSTSSYGFPVDLNFQVWGEIGSSHPQPSAVLGQNPLLFYGITGTLVTVGVVAATVVVLWRRKTASS